MSASRWRSSSSRDGFRSNFAPVESTARRLALLTLKEAHDLVRLLVTVGQESGQVSSEADRLANDTATRIPSEN
ncbi:DUF6417 family protein [Streptomyces sp. NPDC014776]|uniref:DUF6417 family protein n=1 Tax=unclassified Streptomyces TaxID=2593676 RepID=UPI0036FC746A